MDTLEQVVARRLESLDADRRTVPEVLERALRAGERRRRRRRVLGAIASGTGTVALVLAAVVVGSGVGSREGPVDLPAPVPLQDSTLRTELAVLLGSITAEVVPRERGWYDFRAYALAPDGTLFGAEQHYDRTWFDTWGDAQTADVQTGRIESYDVGDVAPMVGGDGQTRLTLEHEDPQHKFDLFCTPRVGGTRTQLSDASVAESSVRIDDGHVVWSTYPDGDEPYRVWTAEGCAGEPRQLEVSGLVRAVSWPDVYLSTPGQPWLVRVDATTGERTDYALPEGLSENDLPGAIGEKEPVDVGAAGSVVAWTVDGHLVVMDAESGRGAVAAADLPVVSGSNGSVVRVTVGDRFVAWSTAPVDGDPSTSQGLLLEVATGRTAAVDGEVWAAGPWVVWLADDGYRVVRTG